MTKLGAKSKVYPLHLTSWSLRYRMKYRYRYSVFDAIFLLASFSRIVFVTRVTTFAEYPYNGLRKLLGINNVAKRQVIFLFPTSVNTLNAVHSGEQTILYEACIYKTFIKLRC